MDKKNLEILGLDENATLEDIKNAYEELRAKYLEERFKDGEVGNNAARMLTKIQVAYEDLIKELSEFKDAESDSDALKKVEELLKSGNYQEAQRVLDNFNERGAEWHYLQSVVFYRKNWMNESKKQLEIAIQLDPENSKYKDAYRKLKEKINYEANRNAQQQDNAENSTYRGETMDSYGGDEQMGGGLCEACIECACLNLCINMACNCCRFG